MTFAGEFLGLPGLRGYWPMGAFDSSGNAIDQSGNGRTLTYTGNPGHNFTTQGASYLDLDGTGDFLTRADEAGLDIIGTESYVNSVVRGLTIGGWFRQDTLGAVDGLIGKWTDSGNQQGYLLLTVAGDITFAISSTGSTSTQYVHPTTISATTWYFIAGRFDPSTEMAIFLNDDKQVTTTSIPASIFVNSAALQVGVYNAGAAGTTLDGRVSNLFLCAMVLSDTAIDNIFQGTRGFYGV